MDGYFELRKLAWIHELDKAFWSAAGDGYGLVQSVLHRKSLFGAAGWVRTKIAERVSKIIDTTKKLLRKAFGQGEPLQTLPAEFDAMGPRTELIAEVETHWNIEAGASIAAVDYGAKTKTWITMGDDRVRHSHASQHDLTIPLQNSFPNGCMFPGDPAGAPETTIGCRCYLRYNL